MSKGSRDEIYRASQTNILSQQNALYFLWRIHQCTADWNGKPFQSETNVPGCNATLWFCSILVMATLSNLGKLSGARSAFGIDSRNGATSCLITEELRLDSNHFISGTMSSVCSLLRAWNLTVLTSTSSGLDCQCCTAWDNVLWRSLFHWTDQVASSWTLASLSGTLPGEMGNLITKLTARLNECGYHIECVEMALRCMT